MVGDDLDAATKTGTFTAKSVAGLGRRTGYGRGWSVAAL